MKQVTLLILAFIVLVIQANAQPYKLGQKAEGGVVFPTNKKKGFAIAEKALGLMSWEEGKKACENLVLNGYDDWRLPSLSELGAVYYQLYVKGIGDFPAGYYWSKAENKGIRQLAWCIDFKDGQEYNSHSKANTKYILPVRSY